nr:immunoglobulin heavy chain junction region [Mus musculus]
CARHGIYYYGSLYENAMDYW